MNLRAVPICALLVLSTSCDRQPGGLSDKSAADLLQDTWNSSRACIPIGELKVVSSGLSFAEGRMDEYMWDFIQKLTEIGVLEAEVKIDLTERFLGWQKWFELTQKGVRKIVIVEVGPKASEAGATVTNEAEGFGGSECLQYTHLSYSIESIIENKVVEHPVERFRLVYGLHIVEFGPLTRMLAEREGESVKPSLQKFRALLKYDPFAQKWRLDSFDVAGRDADFQTKNVLEAITE